MKIYLGIDPGSNGSCVGITEHGHVEEIRFNKSTDKDFWLFLERLAFDYECFIIKEKVWAIPATNTDGTNRSMGASTSFTFGENNGKVIGLLVASGIPYEEKTPQTWQKSFGLKKEKNETQPEYKRRLKQKAEQLFPNVKITLDTSDAYLIAEFCKRLRNGNI